MTVRAWSVPPLIALALVAIACRRGERPSAAAAGADSAVGMTTTSGADFRDPTSPVMNQRAPATFRARFETSKGDFVIEAHRDWAPLGADRFYNLVRSGYYDGARFFRVISGFMAQFGIHADPQVSAAWRGARISDDPVRQSNTRGAVSFATAGPGTRTTQLFINYGDNNRLDGMGFAPFGRVVDGMSVVDRLHAGYGEGAPRGRGPDQGRIEAEGNAYLEREFPELDQIRRATIVAP